MTTSSRSTYVGSLAAMVHAAERLESGLTADRATAAYAAQQLDRRIVEHAEGRDAFAELAFAGDRTSPRRDVAPEDALGGVLVELQAASLALAAAQATRESGMDGDPEPFRRALGELQSTTRELERASAAPDELGFRWHRTIDPGAVEASTDAGAARVRFAGEVATTLDVLVEESNAVITAVADSLRRLPGVSVLDQAIQVARGSETAPQPEGLIGRGLERLRAAIRALTRLLDLPGLDAIAHQLEPLWAKLSDPAALRQALRAVFRAADVAAAAETHAAAINATAPLDDATATLRGLADRYREDMRIARKLLKAMTTALGLAGAAVGALAAFSVVTGLAPYHVALSAAGLLGLMAGVVMTGRDFADSGAVLGRVHGVHAIVRELVE